MRDTVKTEDYFRERYNEDAYYLDKWMSEYQETISHPEKYDIASYYLVQTVDPTWQISTEKLRFPKETNSVYEVVVLSKENKAEAVRHRHEQHKTTA